MDEYIFEITKTLNNIKANNYTVGDYKLCESEAEICMKALELYKQTIQAVKLTVPDVFPTLPKAEKELGISATRTPQLFDLKNSGEF